MSFQPYVPSPVSPEYSPADEQAERQRIADSINTVMRLPTTRAAPARPADGDIIFADAGAWDPGSGTGVYVYHGSAWNKL